MTLHQVFEEADKLLKQAIRQELRDQGHHLTGALENSMKGEITESVQGRNITLTGTALFYSQILHKGTPPERIPFGGGRTGATTSKYITALINYWKLRGLDDTEAKRAAFATAHKQKQEGMPTGASWQHSKTGNRLNFLGVVDKEISKNLNSTVLGGIDKVVEELFRETLNERI